MNPLPPLLAPFALALAACTTTPLAPIPEPLPETLVWAVESVGEEAFLGLKTCENDSGSLDELFFRPGVRVILVVENSPAAAAGFRVGDVVLAFAGHEVNDPAALEALLRAARTDAPLQVQVQRGDAIFDVPVRLRPAGTRGADEARLVHLLDPARSRAGWLTGRGGAVLVASAGDAPFPRAGVAVGSVVTAIDGKEVRSDRALIRLLATYEPGAEVDATFLPAAGDTARTARITLQEQPTRWTGLSLPVLIGYHADADGEATSLVLLDLWIISLFRYEREGNEKEWRVLRFFRWSSGVGELTE